MREGHLTTTVLSPLQRVIQQAETSCIKCGFCLPNCPTYRLTGNEADSPRGRLDLMQAVSQGDLEAEEIFAQLDFCLGCRACETVCPAGVEFGVLLEAGRAEARSSQQKSRWRSWLERVSLHQLLPFPARLRYLATFLRLYQQTGLQAMLRASGLLQRLAPSLDAMEAVLPRVPSWSARQPITADNAPQEQEQGTVAFLTGCVMAELLPQVNRATVHVLTANGYRVLVPPAQRCCGALQAHAGELARARQLATRNIEVFEATGAEWLVVNSAGCGAALKAYAHLLADDDVFAARAKTFSQRVCDVSELLALTPLRGPLTPLPLRAAYDDPCHLLHGQHISQQPRQILRQIPALQLLEVPEGDWCCGSAGLYNLVHVETAQALLDRKMVHIASVQPDVIVTGNPGCMFQLQQGAQRHRLNVEVLHTVEVLARAYE